MTEQASSREILVQQIAEALGRGQGAYVVLGSKPDAARAVVSLVEAQVAPLQRQVALRGEVAREADHRADAAESALWQVREAALLACSALDLHPDHADTCQHALNSEYECNCWRREVYAASVDLAIQARVGAADTQPEWAGEEEGSPFDDVPSGVDLARYFWHETDRRNPGCDGIDLWRDGAEYCYLWVEATIDHDLFVSYLLDVRTKRDGSESRDYLFLHVGAEDRFEVEWRQRPTRFEDDSLDRTRDGLEWFVERDIGAMERHYMPTPTAGSKVGTAPEADTESHDYCQEHRICGCICGCNSRPADTAPKSGEDTT